MTTTHAPAAGADAGAAPVSGTTMADSATTTAFRERTAQVAAAAEERAAPRQHAKD